jgi:hypothetical protein
MKIETYDHGKPKGDFVAGTVVPVLMAISFGALLASQLKASGVFPASSDDRQSDSAASQFS